MKEHSIHEQAILRVQEMESAFDRLQQAWAENPQVFRTDGEICHMLQTVTAYYESPRWQADYRLDEEGAFPAGMKRGILSEDEFYNFLCDVEAYLRQADAGDVQQ